MKNILIAGAARSGKSTLSMQIAKKLEFNHFPLDYIASSFNKHFPECKINNKVVIDEGSKNLSMFLGSVMEHINRTNEKFIVDSAHIMPKDIVTYVDKEKWDLYFMGYPSILSKDKLEIIRKYQQKNDWTTHFSDEELEKIIEGVINISKEIQMQCQELAIPFIDTSREFETTIKKAYNTIILNNQ